MNIPQVNAGATDRNREQTEKICELKGWAILFHKYHSPKDCPHCGRSGKRLITCIDWNKPSRIIVDLINGSFTLDQVAGILKEKGIVFRNNMWRFGGCEGWNLPEGCPCKLLSHEYNEPHDLTAAMDVLIRVLEAIK